MPSSPKHFQPSQGNLCSKAPSQLSTGLVTRRETGRPPPCQCLLLFRHSVGPQAHKAASELNRAKASAVLSEQRLNVPNPAIESREQGRTCRNKAASEAQMGTARSLWLPCPLSSRFLCRVFVPLSSVPLLALPPLGRQRRHVGLLRKSGEVRRTARGPHLSLHGYPSVTGRGVPSTVKHTRLPTNQRPTSPSVGPSRSWACSASLLGSSSPGTISKQPRW